MLGLDMHSLEFKSVVEIIKMLFQNSKLLQKHKYVSMLDFNMHSSSVS